MPSAFPIAAHPPNTHCLNIHKWYWNKSRKWLIPWRASWVIPQWLLYYNYTKVCASTRGMRGHEVLRYRFPMCVAIKTGSLSFHVCMPLPARIALWGSKWAFLSDWKLSYQNHNKIKKTVLAVISFLIWLNHRLVQLLMVAQWQQQACVAADGEKAGLALSISSTDVDWLKSFLKLLLQRNKLTVLSRNREETGIVYGIEKGHSLLRFSISNVSVACPKSYSSSQVKTIITDIS